MAAPASPVASAVSSRSSEGLLSRRCGGATSRTEPPPTLAPPPVRRAKPRRMKRSPGSSARGSSSRWMRAKLLSPGSIRSLPIGARRARRSAVPARNSTGIGLVTAGASGSRVISASSARVGCSASGAETTRPRERSASSTPCRFTAQRAPGLTCSEETPKLWRPRTRALRPIG